MRLFSSRGRRARPRAHRTRPESRQKQLGTPERCTRHASLIFSRSRTARFRASHSPPHFYYFFSHSRSARLTVSLVAWDHERKRKNQSSRLERKKHQDLHQRKRVHAHFDETIEEAFVKGGGEKRQMSLVTLDVSRKRETKKYRKRYDRSYESSKTNGEEKTSKRKKKKKKRRKTLPQSGREFLFFVVVLVRLFFF